MDIGFAELMNQFLKGTNGVLTPFFKVITLFGNGGIGFIILALILFLFKKTRSKAICLAIAFIIGFACFELALKNIVRRPRPFTQVDSVYYAYWLDAGSLHQSGFSFPSGHTTVAVEFALIFFWFTNKKYSWLFLFIPILMGMTRTYFMVHYLTDVLGGLVAGTISTLIALGIYSKISKTNWFTKLVEAPNFFIKKKKQLKEGSDEEF